jgi:peptidoglycan/xylan/chitin deacetylase (PgdA/CDA1 family)
MAAGWLWWGVLSAGLFFFLIVLGTAFPRLSIHTPCLCKVKVGKGLVALTFDDGPHPIHTRAVLDTLDTHNAKATFFLLGTKALAQADLVREIVARGHQVENHSWAHEPWFPIKSTQTLARDLARTSSTLEALTGHPTRWFRPPFGVVSPPIASGAARAGLNLCGWSATARDGSPRRKNSNALKSLMRGLTPGAILALHDAPERGNRAPATVVILESLLGEMEKKGLRSVTLNGLLAAKSGRQSPT